MSFDLAELTLSLPLLVVAVGGVLVLLLEAFSGRTASRAWLAVLTLAILGLATALEIPAWEAAATPRAIYGGMIAVDRFSIFLSVTIFVGAGLSTLLAGGFLREHRFEFGEFYALILLGTAGMMILVQANDLVTIFLGIEIMSLAVYVLTGSWRRSAKSSEAAMKYFLVGSFASAILLYGIALVYGTSGTTNLLEIGKSAVVTTDPVFLIGTFLILGGLAFKVAAVPFHMWAPDAYEGAPTPVTAFMAAAVKAAGFGVLVRILVTAFGRPSLTFGAGGWASIAAALAILTMTLGNVAALRQDNIKRMLAYSSVAHAGYLLVGIVAMGRVGDEARGPILYYLLAYSLTTVGSFGVIAWFGSHGDERQHIDDWAGLGARHPAAALAMTVLLLSLGGIPLTAGFFGKLYLFKVALMKPGLVPLVIIAVANSLISIFYYLRVVTAMYFREVGRATSPLRSRGVTAALILATVGTLALGLLPGWAIDLATQATILTK
ncbi:MAG: NADH-quinone oxidoreductase subunit N [Myxococcales bacterium]|nr:NADH-quinone oxidoreductase subunit N [Myxococcales bacterium]